MYGFDSLSVVYDLFSYIGVCVCVLLYFLLIILLSDET